ncbi:hypothetical protein D1816_14545 [Aquimarina sp. AD10]|uniref:Uncharacterized protein n=1 Tax=Aquimarina aggregata TaxID=1642818 RepID=A0A162WM06_9FLAO|nr:MULTISPECIES: hypothetical protein [Aquimarina]AXT61520.1 hypothetical protein D1816_14545 [Aquimarina sp. AD10]KZS38185.1 hypothetical protein AWE51_19290 [Aquimarina aggregata]
MKNIIIILVVFFGYQGMLKAQESKDLLGLQNPNYEVSLKKYDSIRSSYTLQQGTTLQETYTARDPIEEKRERRAQRRLRRHERALARAQNPTYAYGYDPYYFNAYGVNGYGYNYSNDLSVPVAIGLGVLEVALWSTCFW